MKGNCSLLYCTGVEELVMRGNVHCCKCNVAEASARWASVMKVLCSLLYCTVVEAPVMKGNYVGIDTVLRQPWPLAARTILSAQENINVTTGPGCSKNGISQSTPTHRSPTYCCKRSSMFSMQCE